MRFYYLLGDIVEIVPSVVGPHSVVESYGYFPRFYRGAIEPGSQDLSVSCKNEEIVSIKNGHI